MQFAEINGITLHYQVIGGATEKPPIVFVNSLGTDFRIWRDVIMRMVGNYPVVAYDKRGHGLSGLGEPPYSMDDHVGDLEGLLDFLNVKSAVICGVSVGGLIAQGLASTRPDLCRALILCDTGARIGSDAMWNERIAAIEKGGIEAISDAILDRWFSNAFQSERQPEYNGYANMLIRTPKGGYTGTGAAIRDTDYTETSSQLKLPVMVMVGEEDGATPLELNRKLASLIEGAEFHEIKNAGHLPSIEQPEAVANLMKSFLTRLAANGNLSG